MPLASEQRNPAANAARVAPINVEDELLTRQYVANWLGVHPYTLHRWAREGRGPRCLWIGGLARYRRGDVQECIESGKLQNAAPRKTLG